MILLGDCREVLPAACPDPGVIVTDPPFGIGYTSGWGRTSGVWDPRLAGATYGSASGSIVGDDDGWAWEWLRDTYPNTPAAVFGSWQLGPPWPKPRIILVWDKGPASGMGDLRIPWKPNHSPIYVYGTGWHGKRTTSILQGRVPSRISFGRTHPHEKSVDVIAEIIGKAPPGVVLDPFAGTGATLVAAARLGREALGVEIEPRYVQAATEREAAA